MTSLSSLERFKQAVSPLTTNIFKRMLNLPEKIQVNTQEIRIRLNRPISVCCPDNIYFLTENGCLTNKLIDQPMLTVNQRDIADTFHNICNYSVYARQNEIKNGFVTMQGGHRAGICGTAVYECESVINIRDISSINIRVAKEYKGCADKIIKYQNIFSQGLLICGPPCSGKTTIIRDMARQLSLTNQYKVSIIDERGEIAGTVKGIYQNDIGISDVFDGYSKPQGIIQAIRTMSPDIVICDEIGGFDDVETILNVSNSGVAFIATIHCRDVEELRKKPYISKLLKSGAFENILFLDGRNNAGNVIKFKNSKEILSA